MDYSNAPLPEVFQHFLKTNPFLFAGSNVLLQKPVGSGEAALLPPKSFQLAHSPMVAKRHTCRTAAQARAPISLLSSILANWRGSSHKGYCSLSGE